MSATAAGGRTRTIGVVMNGVTGRMGTNQHLIRSVLAIREDGGVPISGGTRVVPEPILVGRDAAKLDALAARHGVRRATTSLSEALAADDAEIYFDAQATSAREDAIRTALEAGKHVFSEKPLAESSAGALALARMAREVGVRTGVVQDKLFLPGIRKLRRLVESDFFGRILSVRGEFGYWVFEGDGQTPQRPSWNYRAEDGGGIVLDMFPHWEYVLRAIGGRVTAVSCVTATHVPRRVDENGTAYDVTADDAAYAIFELEGGVVAQINSSWTVRVHRDELVQFQVDGTAGSAIAGLRRCFAQHRGTAPRPIWNPDIADPNDYRSQWAEVPDNGTFENGFRAQWELFLRHVTDDAPFPWDFLAGARGAQLAELGLESARTQRRVEVPELSV